MRRIVLTFGLIAGALLAALMVVQIAFIDRIGFDRGALVGYTTMVLAFLFIFFGVRTYRDTVGGGTIAFRRALGIGLLIALVASACYVITWEVLYNWFVPDFLDRYAAHAAEKARAAGATAEQLAAQAREAERFRSMYANPIFRAAITLLEVFPVGLVMSLVAAGILRRPAARGERAAVMGRSSAVA